MAQQKLFPRRNKPTGRKSDGGTVRMMEGINALRIALEEGESSPDVNDFDAKKFLQKLKEESRQL